MKTLQELMLRMEAINNRKSEIAELAKGADFSKRNDLAQLDEEINNIDTEAKDIRAQMLTIKSNAQFEPVVVEHSEKDERGVKINELELRAKNFAECKKSNITAAETRSVLLATGGIAKPTGVGGINDMFPTAISIVDKVMVNDSTGMGAYTVSFQKSLQSASEKTDGVAQSGSDPVFGKTTIQPFLCATTTYVSRELSKQTPLNYYNKVWSGALKALKVKLAEWITKGGGVNKMKGILNSVDDSELPVSMNKEYAVSVNTVDENFLRDLVLDYGGDANAYGGVGILQLNKADLMAFGKIRGADKKSVYEITPDTANPNMGILKEGGLSVQYIINPNLISLTASTIPTDASKINTMIYGIPTNYELSLFGNYEISESRDYKFAEGLITIMGEVMVGGAVTVQNGFSVVTLKKA